VPPSEYQPQLATLVKEPPRGDEWLHEIKYDGYRIGCRIKKGAVALYSRNGKNWTSSFPTIVDAARGLKVDDALIDGEVAIVLPDGRTSFQALQNVFGPSEQRTDRDARGTLVYFVFDLLRANGERLNRLPLKDRKTRLSRLVGKPRKFSRIRYSEHVTGSGEAFFEQACRHGLEGIVSKRRDLPYQPGRHGGWLKTKCVLEQEFVIGGFTDPQGARVGIGALLVGYYNDAGQLVFSGKVGTGFTHTRALELRNRLDRIETKTCPFDPPPAGWLGKHAHWVRPALVGDVIFAEWTSDGKIRHASFQGLRADKPARAVRRERAANVDVVAAASPRRRGRPNESHTVMGVRITHPDRVIYNQPPVTKIDLARYYERVANWIEPHVKGRPLTLVRCPEALSSGCFFMKHSKVWAPEPLRRVRIQEKLKLGEYLIADNSAAVIGLVQMGVLEIHTWNSVFDDLERPNRLVFDLDPGEQVPWHRVIEAAKTMRAALRAIGLESWVKTTGGKGLHVVAPLVPHADWSECLAFSRAFAETIERTEPDRYTTQFAKVGRGRKILIDYLRNNRTNTSIAALSTRARAHAPVSTPINWDELRNSLDPAQLTLHTVPKRLEELRRDPWADYWVVRQRLTKPLLKAVGGEA
jgi:bifunctional non-homologous end joining protein LigD